MENLTTILIQRAKEKNICAEGLRQLYNLDKVELVDYYLSIPDWCLERNFPDLTTIKQHFAECEGKGVFVGKTFKGETLSGLQTYIFHNCKGTVKIAMDYDNAIIPMLYLANGCRLRITCDQEENAGSPIRVPVYIFGKNDVSARSNKYAIFTKYKNNLI